MSKLSKKQKKAFVVDTNVILSDPKSIFNFGANDVVLPMVVLQELDKFKKGTEEKNKNARQFHRLINELMVDGVCPKDGIRLSPLSELIFQVWEKEYKSRTKLFPQDSNDHRLLDIALQLKYAKQYEDVVLITADINLQIKARMLKISVEHYRADDADLALLKQGIVDLLIPEEELSVLNSKKVSSEDCPILFAQLSQLSGNLTLAIRSKAEDNPLYYKWWNGKSELLKEKWKIQGLSPKNSEQAFVLEALIDESIGVVALTGPAGTGKTLMTLLAALDHLQHNRYDRVLVGRPMMEVSDKTMGFLPGTVEEKIEPYFAPIYDNLEFIRAYNKGAKGKSNSKAKKSVDKTECSGIDQHEMPIKIWAKQQGIEFFPLNFLRGRSLPNQLIIVDEAQNMTPHEMKTLITRLGEGSKVVVIGDTHQVDCPYLTEKSNGLSYLIQCWSDRPEFFHLHLSKGERSTIASIAAEIM